VYRDSANSRAALHKPVVSPAKEAAENTVRASQIGKTVKVAETSEACSVS